MLNDLLKNLPVLNETQLKEANKERLSLIFNQISTLKTDLDRKAMDAKIQLNTKQNEVAALNAEIQNEFGTTSIEELEALKEEKIKKLVELGEDLNNLINNGVTNG
jgi:hypothetical protein